MRHYYTDFVTQVGSQAKDPITRGKLVAAAIATAISMTQSLPSSYTSSASDYFNNNVMPQAHQIISAFNESVVFDTHAALTFTRQLWQLRYWSAFQHMQSLNLRGADFFGTFTGVDVVIPELTRKLFDENAGTIVSLSQFAVDAINAAQTVSAYA